MGDVLAATNGTEQRLDVLIARVDRVIELLASASPPAPAVPEDGATVELREPETPAKPRRSK